MAFSKLTTVAQKYLDADKYIEEQCDGNKHLTSLIEAAKAVTNDRLERKLIIAMLKSDDLLEDYGFFSWATDQICSQHTPERNRTTRDGKPALYLVG